MSVPSRSTPQQYQPHATQDATHADIDSACASVKSAEATWADRDDWVASHITRLQENSLASHSGEIGDALTSKKTPSSLYSKPNHPLSNRCISSPSQTRDMQMQSLRTSPGSCRSEPSLNGTTKKKSSSLHTSTPSKTSPETEVRVANGKGSSSSPIDAATAAAIPAPLFAQGFTGKPARRGVRNGAGAVRKGKRNMGVSVSWGSNIVDLHDLAAEQLRSEQADKEAASLKATVNSQCDGSSGLPCSETERKHDGRGAESLLTSDEHRTSRYENPPPSKVLDFLFIGSVNDAKNAAFLRKNNITTIINVSAEEYWAADKSVTVRTFTVNDTIESNIEQYFGETTRIIDEVRKVFYAALKRGDEQKMKRVLVHCQKGRSRSATVVLAYLILRNGWSVAEAIQYVAHRRPCIEPNLGFIESLRRLQESMDSVKRDKLHSSLCLVVRNLSCDNSANDVERLFETNVGCVKEVSKRLRAARATPSSNVVTGPFAEHIDAATNCSRSNACRPMPATDGATQDSSLETGSDESHKASKSRNDSLSQESKPKETSAEKSVASRETELQGANHSDPNQFVQGKKECSRLSRAIDAARENHSSSISPDPQMSALFFVVFAAQESIGRALSRFDKTPGVAHTLKTTPGKTVKLAIPQKIAGKHAHGDHHAE